MPSAGDHSLSQGSVEVARVPGTLHFQAESGAFVTPRVSFRQPSAEPKKDR